jgi:DNA-binding SARP family transcriptional activator
MGRVSSEAVSKLDVHLFGRFRVGRSEQTHVAIEGAKAQELFAYLLLNRRRSCRRETLAEVLWPENSAAQARKYFRQTLWQLQLALGEDGPVREDRSSTLLVEQEWLRINPDAQVWLDVDVLESAMELCQGTPGTELTSTQANALRRAVRLYDGELLESWPQEWCLYERERLLLGYLQLLDKLMAFCEAHHAYEEAVEYGVQSLHTDRARERTHRNLMRLHYLAGDRAEAVRQYARCCEALREELDVEPSAKTKGLYEQILAERLEMPAPVGDPSDVAASLAALRSLLVGFDAHIRSAFEHLERLAGSRGESHTSMDC